MDFFRSIMIHQQEEHSFLNEDTMHLLHFFLYMPSKSNKTQPRFGILDAKNIDPGLLSLDHVTHRKPGTGNVVIPRSRSNWHVVIQKSSCSQIAIEDCC